MCISRVYCEDNLNVGIDNNNNNVKLLFTILVRSPDEQVRSNLIISIGDLCIRVPNQLEQWTSRIYHVLQDEVGKDVYISFIHSFIH